jgi:sRNA-binding carbon storage regulator CsrA
VPLYLTRHAGEAIWILAGDAGDVRIEVQRTRRGTTQISIDAPQSMRIIREELLSEPQRDDLQAEECDRCTACDCLHPDLRKDDVRHFEHEMTQAQFELVQLAHRDGGTDAAAIGRGGATPIERSVALGKRGCGEFDPFHIGGTDATNNEQ